MAITHPELSGLDMASVQYDVVYAPLLDHYPADAEIVLFQHGPNGTAPRVRRACVHDRQAFLRAVADLGDAERIDLPLAPRDPQRMAARAAELNKSPRYLRGNASECHPLPCLMLDIDVAHPRHSERDLPTVTQARRLISELPLAPSLVTQGPGGFHVFIGLAETLAHRPVTDDPNEVTEQADALARLAQWLERQGEAGGFAVDTSPIRADGGLRVAGTVAGKGGPEHHELQVIDSLDERARHTYADIVAVLPEAEARHLDRQRSAGRTARQSSSDRAGVVLPLVDDDDEPIRPGTRLAAAWPVSRMLTEVFGAELTNAGRPGALWPRPDGTVGDDEDHGEFKEKLDLPEVEVFTVYGNRCASEWDVEQGSNQSSWDLLGKVVCGGDWKLAGRVAGSVMANTDDEDVVERNVGELEALLREAVRDGEDLPTVVAGMLDGPAGAPVAEVIELPERSVAHAEPQPQQSAALATPDPTEFRVDGDTVAVITGPELGLYRTRVKYDDNGNLVKNSQGQVIRVRESSPIIEWVATRSTMHVEDGDVASATFDVRVLTRSGREVTIPQMSAADSLSVQKVFVEANSRRAGITQPSSIADKAAVSNMLATLGEESQRESRIRRTTGTVVGEDGRHRFLGRVSSVTADGVDNVELAHPPRGTTNSKKTRPVLRGIGWSKLPQDEAAAAAAFRALIEVAPSKPVVGIALAGVFAAGVAGCNERTTVIIDGPTSSAKSQAASCLTPFYSLAERSTEQPPVYLPEDSLAYVAATMRSHAYLPVWLDDARLNTETRFANEKSLGVISASVQMAFNGSSGGRGTADGGARDSESVDCPAVMTAERISSQQAILNRSVVIAIDEDTVERFRDEANPQWVPALDRFHRGFAATRLANEAGASFIRWVMRQLDDRTGIAADTGEFHFGDGGESEAMLAAASWMKRHRAEFAAQWGGTREALNAGYLRAGWELLFLWADSMGVRGQLPTAEEVDAALSEVATVTAAAAESSNPGVRFIGACAAALEAQRGHITTIDGQPPSEAEAVHMGWRRSGDRLDSMGPKIGILSRDGKHVVLTKQGVREAARATDQELVQYSGREIDRFLMQQCVVELTGKGADRKVSTRLGFDPKRRPSGYVVTVDQLFGAGDDEEQTAAESTPEEPAPVSRPAGTGAKPAPRSTPTETRTCADCRAEFVGPLGGPRQCHPCLEAVQF